MLKGRRRVETDRFIALRSHYLFASQFTTPGLEGAHEKGGVEGEVGRYRRNHLVPVPELRDLAELNAMLLAGCEQDLGRRIDGRPVTVGQAWAVERPLLLALPAEPFDACETAVPRVDAKSLVTIRQNRYSVPVRLAGLKVSARIGAREITINHCGREVARHERLHGKFGTSAQLDHYLELLQRKPGGLEHSVALGQERDRGAWPECFDQAVGRADRALRTLGRRPADGRRRAALPRARPGPGGARRPRRARRRRDRRTRRRGSRPPHVEHRRTPRRCRSPASTRACTAHERPAPDLTDYDQLLGGSR